MGSSAAKEMDDRRMKRRMMLVKVVALMMRWQSFRNLDGTQKKNKKRIGIGINQCKYRMLQHLTVIVDEQPLLTTLIITAKKPAQSPWSYLFRGPKMKKELASGMGTDSSFSCRSAIGRGLGLWGMFGSSSSSSPTKHESGGLQAEESCRFFGRRESQTWVIYRGSRLEGKGL